MSVQKIKTSSGQIKWEATVYTHGRHGKKLRRRFDKRIDADNFMHQYRLSKEQALSGPPSAISPEETTLEDEIQFYLNKRADTFTPGYWRVLNPALKVIRQLYSSYPVSKITPGLIDDFNAFLKARGTSTSTQNRYAQVIQRVVNFSFLNDRISYNPLKRYRKQKEVPVELVTWNDEEMAKFLSFANTKYPHGTKDRWIFVVYFMALETGSRANEIWGLKPEDVRFGENLIHIRRQLISGGSFAPTKGKDQRVVPMGKELAAEIRFLLKKRKVESDTVFCTEAGSPIDHQNFVNRIFKKDLRQSKVRKLRFHDLRHTALTSLVRTGVGPWMVQSIAGHKDLKTTMRYVHLAGTDIAELGKSRSLFGQSEGNVVRIFGGVR